MNEQSQFSLGMGPEAKTSKLVSAEYILLDYVQTLVGNGSDPQRDQLMKLGRYRDWIKLEQFRPWLVNLLAAEKVILITARNKKYAEPTMARIKAHGVKLVAAYFSPADMEPPAAKSWLLTKEIFPKFGKADPGRYLALESNGKTRAMYSRVGIVSMPVPYGEPTWKQMPKIPAA